MGTLNVDNYLGQIIEHLPIASGGYVPRGYAMCAGQKIPIKTFQALFSILGADYGYDPQQQYFFLPDLRGKHPLDPADGRSTVYCIAIEGIYPRRPD